MAQKQKLSPRIAGVDVSAKTLHVSIAERDGEVTTTIYENTAEDQAKIIARLTARRAKARVLMEATGVYHLDFALALHAAKVEVIVVNPRAASAFATSRMTRAKTDAVDSKLLLEFARWPGHIPWTPPRSQVLAVRAVGRRIGDLRVEHTRELCRLDALNATGTASAVVKADIAVSLEALAKRDAMLQAHALELIKGDAEILEAYRHITTITGVKDRTAVVLLGELLVLDPEMTPAELVAHAGLDPRPHESGTSVRGRRGISKTGNARIRAALFMPALTASQHCPPLRQVYDRLVAAGKLKKVALVAVERKLLELVWVLIRRKQDFDLQKTTARTPQVSPPAAVEAPVPPPEATEPVANIASTDREDLAPEAGPELSAPLERRSEPEAGHLRVPSGGLADPIREPTTRSRPTRSTPVSRRPPKAAS